MRVEEFDELDVQKTQIARKTARKNQTPLVRLQNAITGIQGAQLTDDEIVQKFVTKEE